MIRPGRSRPAPRTSTGRAPASRYAPAMDRLTPPARLARWSSRWSAIAPLLLAEFIVWLGFGCLLPVLPLYFVLMK